MPLPLPTSASACATCATSSASTMERSTGCRGLALLPLVATRLNWWLAAAAGDAAPGVPAPGVSHRPLLRGEMVERTVPTDWAPSSWKLTWRADGRADRPPGSGVCSRASPAGCTGGLLRLGAGVDAARSAGCSGGGAPSAAGGTLPAPAGAGKAPLPAGLVLADPPALPFFPNAASEAAEKGDSSVLSRLPSSSIGARSTCICGTNGGRAAAAGPPPPSASSMLLTALSVAACEALTGLDGSTARRRRRRRRRSSTQAPLASTAAAAVAPTAMPAIAPADRPPELGCGLWPSTRPSSRYVTAVGLRSILSGEASDLKMPMSDRMRSAPPGATQGSRAAGQQED